MNKCTNCNIIIYDDSDACPLCHKIVDSVGEEDKETLGLFRESMSGYPDVRSREKKISLMMRIILFAIIVSEIVAILINYIVTPEFMWSAIAGFSAFYFYFSMIYWIRHDSGIAKKIGLTIILTTILLIAIDFYTGYRGWAISWAIPGLILLGNAIVFVFMLIYIENWYSYSVLLIFFTICSVIILAIHLIGGLPHKILPIICVGVTGLYLLGTVIFGAKQFGGEMRRRLHV